MNLGTCVLARPVVGLFGSSYNTLDMRALDQCLLDAESVRLRVIARLWDVDLSDVLHRDTAVQLAQAMATPEAVTRVWDTLPNDQRRALEALLAAEGQMPRRVFARRWGEIRTMGPGRMDRDRPWREPISPAEALWYKGLLFHTLQQGPDHAYEAVFIPPEIQAHLPTAAISQPTITLESVSEPVSVRSAGDDLLDDACTLLAYLQNRPLQLSSGGQWPERRAAELVRRLRDPDLERFAFLRHLAYRIGWMHEGKSGHLRPNPKPVTAWLQSSTDQQRSAMAEAWQDDTAWNDLFHVPSLHPEDTGAWRNDPLLARKAILRHLGTCAPRAWYELDDLVASIKRVDPDFQRPGGDYTTWYIRDAASGAYLSGFRSWDDVEGALIRYLIAKPLAWLGLVDLGAADPDGPPTAFRLSRAGASFLGLDESPSEPEPPPLDLRSDFTVLVPPTRRYERFQLARVADWTRADDPFVYRLTPSSLDRARRQGISITRVLEFLNQVTHAPLPRPIEAALTRWKARGAEARLERVVLLRLSDEDLMTRVTSSPRTSHVIRERLGPTAALVRESGWPRLVAILGEMGLLTDVIALERNHADQGDIRLSDALPTPAGDRGTGPRPG